LTIPLGDFIAALNNVKNCIGIVGSGNRNFNNQYCLTAKQYSERFGFPMLGDFELRGTSSDVERIANIIVETLSNFKA
ncbi:nrdI protein, partial [Streptococcus agalactiae COH1]